MTTTAPLTRPFASPLDLLVNAIRRVYEEHGPEAGSVTPLELRQYYGGPPAPITGWLCQRRLPALNRYLADLGWSATYTPRGKSGGVRYRHAVLTLTRVNTPCG